jgi:hypothetical protein
VRLGVGVRGSQAEEFSETASLVEVQVDGGIDVNLRTEIFKKTTAEDPENRECLGSSLLREVASVDPQDHTDSCDENLTNLAALGRQYPRESGACLGKTTALQERTVSEQNPR